MLNIKQAVGAVVANDTQNSVASLDLAVAQQARLCASLIEAAQDSKMPIASTQRLLDALSASMRGLVASRGDLASAVAQIVKIQGASSLRETDFGCPEGFECKQDPVTTVHSVAA